MMWFKTSLDHDVVPHSRWHVLPHWKHPAVRTVSSAPRTALVTGASSGIGAELARLLAEDEYNLVLVARDRDRLLSSAAELESRHGVTVTPIARDLATPDSADAIRNDLRQRAIAIDILVNNAGFAVGGRFASADVSQTVQLLNVNVVALTHLTRLLLPEMISRRWGRVLNVASIAGFYPGPLTACYNASKAYVISLSLALHSELKGSGVTSTCLCPGPTATRFAERANLLGTRAFRENVMQPAPVALAGYRAMMSGKPIVIAGMRNKLRMFPIPWVPNSVLAHFSRKYHEVLAG